MGRELNAAHEQGQVSATTELSDRDREIIAFERQWWKYAGAKEQAIRELFDMSATRYYQVLNALIDSQAALEADPMLDQATAPTARLAPARPQRPTVGHPALERAPQFTNARAEATVRALLRPPGVRSRYAAGSVARGTAPRA